jgi:hypothetical protein
MFNLWSLASRTPMANLKPFHRHQQIIEQLNSIFDNNMDSKAENISEKFKKMK